MINNILHAMEIYELEGEAEVFITTPRRKTKVHEKSRNGKFSPQGPNVSSAMQYSTDLKDRLLLEHL